MVHAMHGWAESNYVAVLESGDVEQWTKETDTRLINNLKKPVVLNMD